MREDNQLDVCNGSLDICRCVAVCETGRRYVRLTDELVESMRSERDEGEKLEYLASKYGIHISTAWRICVGRTR